MNITIDISDDSSSIPEITSVQIVPDSLKKDVAAHVIDPIDDNLAVASVQDAAASTSSSPSGASTSGSNKMKSVGCSSKNNTKKKAHTALDRKAEAEKQRLGQKPAKTNKAHKPKECMKDMYVEVHPRLASEWYMADLSRELAASGARLVRSPDLYWPELVLWARAEPRTLTSDNDQLKLSAPRSPCGHAMYVMTATAVGELWRDGAGGGGGDGSAALCQLLGNVSAAAACKLTLVVYGTNDYFKTSSRKTLNSTRNKMTEDDLEMVIADLMVKKICDTILVDTPNDLAMHIVRFTKALAESDIKKAKRAIDDQADFYMRGDNKNCVPVDKDGVGVSKLWQQMIAVLPMSSLETSRAICAKYPNPRALLEALQASDSVNQIADIGVARTAVPGSQTRRVGPEFARKLKILFTAEDGNTLLE